MTPTELAEVYRPRVERVADTYRGRGVKESAELHRWNHTIDICSVV